MRCRRVSQCSRSAWQTHVLGLDDEEVAECELESDPAAVDDVVLPGDVVERDRVDVLVEDEGEGDGEVEDVETLGTERVGQDLNSVGNNERGEGQTARRESVSVAKET